MATSPSKSLVRQPGAPPPHVDYRFDLTRRSVAGYATAGVAVAFLIFLSGLVLGVRMALPVRPAPAGPAAASDAAPAEAADVGRGAQPGAGS